MAQKVAEEAVSKGNLLAWPDDFGRA